MERGRKSGFLFVRFVRTRTQHPLRLQGLLRAVPIKPNSRFWLWLRRFFDAQTWLFRNLAHSLQPKWILEPFRDTTPKEEAGFSLDFDEHRI